MRRSMTLSVCLLLAGVVTAQSRPRPAGKPPGPPPAPTAPAAGAPLVGLTVTQLAAFTGGLADFQDVEEVSDGLGPIFNERSCAACHTTPAIGGGSTRTVTRVGRRVNGVFDPLASLGGSLIQDHALGLADGIAHAFVVETVPPSATIVVKRRTTPLFGLGLVDATPDADFIALAAAQAARRDDFAGRVSMVDNIRAGTKTVGKFGWKAQQPTLFQFAGDAYLNEMGITTADFPNESCPQGNCAELAFNPAPGINDDGTGPGVLQSYMSQLAPPPRGPQNADTNEGEATFDRIGCTTCHVTTFRTGSNANGSLDRVTYHPYSDFLLHDMGSLGDDIEQGSATGKEMRTAPLWGLRFLTAYLHDGRATTLEQAITAHQGQGRASADRFAALSNGARTKLLAFLRSL
jgi:CxxC motif-containing protein (DUF1111 family)